MKRRPPIFIISFAILACCAAFLLINSPTSRPASISFLWYTNRVKGAEEARAIGDEAEAIFQLTNHTSSSLRCTFSIDGSNAVSGLVSYSSGESTLPGHTTYCIPIVAPSSTNGWQFSRGYFWACTTAALAKGSSPSFLTKLALIHVSLPARRRIRSRMYGAAGDF